VWCTQTVRGPRDSTLLTPSGSTAAPVSMRGGASLPTRSATLMVAVCPSGDTAFTAVSLMVTVAMVYLPFRPPAAPGRRAASGFVRLRALLAGLAHEHQHLAGADHGVLGGLVAVDHRGALRVDVEAVAVTPADLAHRHVADGQLLAVRAVTARHHPHRVL